MVSIRGVITGTNALVWRTVNKAGVPWYKLPGPAGALNLAALREDLRHDNLHETRDDVENVEIANLPAYRTYDGTMQDPYDAEMGSAGTRFGRNFALDHTKAEEPPRLPDAFAARGQPQALLARPVPAGRGAQRPGRGLDPVPEPRLVRPRGELQGDP